MSSSAIADAFRNVWHQLTTYDRRKWLQGKPSFLGPPEMLMISLP